jgi:hypothetical protein
MGKAFRQEIRFRCADEETAGRKLEKGQEPACKIALVVEIEEK